MQVMNVRLHSMRARTAARVNEQKTKQSPNAALNKSLRLPRTAAFVCHPQAAALYCRVSVCPLVAGASLCLLLLLHHCVGG
jgi:hypothetical protein